jgi:predicted ATPase/Flp pilus assembly protein TadD
VAADLLEEHPDGTWFVELAGTADPALVHRVVLSTIGIREQQGRLILDTLVHHLATRATLLVLDNCEHLLDACAELADRLLRAYAGLTILATSREPLGITGEVVRRVPPLSIPEATLAPSAETVASFEAVQLFVDRAVAAEPRFSLTDANAAAVMAICRRLEGIPLALELAAARLQALTVEQIRDRLEDRFRLLTEGSRTALPRQQMLRATVDWSHDLLTEPERFLLRRLSVFAGGFSLDAAEQVCGDRQVAPEDVLDLFTRLVGRSLALLEAGPASGRYRLLETIREYALEKLREGGEEPELRRRHLKYYIGFAEPAEPALRGPAQQAWLDRLHAELDNFRAAFGWSLRQQDPEPALRLASALLEFWVVRADWSEGLEWVERALDLPGEVDPAMRMKALRAAAELADVLSDYPRSTARYEESLSIGQNLGYKRMIARSLTQLAEVALLEGKAAEARGLFEETLPIWEEIGHKSGLRDSLRGLGDVARQEGDLQGAESFLQQSLEVCRAIGSLEGEARALQSLGTVAMSRGDHDVAESLHREALDLLQRMEHLDGIAVSLRALGTVAAAAGWLNRAARLLSASEALRERVGGTVSPWDRAEFDRAIERLRSGLGTEAFRREWESGRQCTVAEAVRLSREATPASAKDGGVQEEALEDPSVS